MKNLPVILWSILMLGLPLFSSAQSSTLELPAKDGKIKITPISHATMLIQYGDWVIATDPTGGAAAFEGLPKPNLILITDIHGDHMSVETLQAIGGQNIPVVAPQAVADNLADFTKVTVIANGANTMMKKLNIAAIPMYNLPEDEASRHTKGRGNGYVLTLGGKKIYISGDTEDITEMRALKGIDLAFVCMNLPYTMDVFAAADAVLAFKPKRVAPYHYRGQGGLSDVAKFKELVNAGDSKIEVTLLNWYP